jgi:transcriptional regulator with XRE-family HTH domain
MDGLSHQMTSLSTSVYGMNDEYFSPWLRHQLQRREWTPADFARRLNASEGTVSHWLRGERLPRPSSVDRIAEALGLPLEDVMRRAGYLPPEQRSPDDAYKDEIKALIDGIPVSVLGPVKVMLQGLYDDAQRNRMRVIEGRRAADEHKRYAP